MIFKICSINDTINLPGQHLPLSRERRLLLERIHAPILIGIGVHVNRISEHLRYLFFFVKNKRGTWTFEAHGLSIFKFDFKRFLIFIGFIENAGYFLTSYSAYQAFLNSEEMSENNGIDYNELRETLYSSIENMLKAKAVYTNLKVTSEKIPYNQAMIDQLITFDYDSFQVKYGLIEPIFGKIKALLGKGDIAGFDVAVLANMDSILCKLYEVKSVVDKDQFLEISLLWRINQAYAEDHLFGQYVSEVFKANLGI